MVISLKPGRKCHPLSQIWMSTCVINAHLCVYIITSCVRSWLKPETMKLVFSASQLSTQHERVRAKT